MSSRFFWKSVAVAVLLTISGFGYSGYMQHKLSTTQRTCETESQAKMATINAQRAKESGPWTEYQTAEFTCDPSKLDADVSLGEDTPGIQGELLRAYHDANSNTQNIFYGIALLTVLVGVLPAFWYFFLARLTEIATAVRRK